MVGARQDSGGVSMTNVSGSLTKIGGEAKHTLTIAEMPAHSHSYNDPETVAGHNGDYGVYYSGFKQGTTGSSGGGQPHNILPSYYALCFIMKIS